MQTRGILLRALLSSAALLLLVLLGAFWVTARQQRDVLDQRLRADMLDTARLLAAVAAEEDGAKPGPRLSAWAERQAERDWTTVVVGSEREVLVDSTGGIDWAQQLQHLPEVDEAFRQGEAAYVRQGSGYSASVVVAVRVDYPERGMGLVWMSAPANSIAVAWHTLLPALRVSLLIAAVGVLVLGGLLAAFRRQFLHALALMTHRLSRGRIEGTYDDDFPDEYAELVIAVRGMRDRLRADMESVARQRHTLAALINQLQEGVVVTEANGHIALINPAARQLLQLPSDAGGKPRPLVGEPLERCIPLHEAQRLLRGEAIDSATVRAIAEPHERISSSPSLPEPHEQEARIQVKGPSGTMQLLARASDVKLPLDDDSGDTSAVGRMLVLTDITELTRAMRMRTDFVANASHELRTPLSTIRAAVETLQQMNFAEDAAAAQRFIAAIDRQSTRLEALVGDLLDLSRLESASARYEPEELNVHDVLEDLRLRFSERLESRGVQWEAICEAAPDATVSVHPHLLRLVLDNLVDNAIKFTEPDGVVAARCDVEDSVVIFAVIDTGCGIPRAEQTRVFERFYQVERARSGNERGTGLGLSIVRHAIASLGGHVTLESRLGEGTTVTVRIPQPPQAP